MKSPFRYFKTSPEIIRLAVMMYVRFPLSLRNVADLLHERGIEVSHETIRFWWNRFGPIFAAELRKKRKGRMRALSGCLWHLDEVFVKINGERHYLWRAVDQEGEVLEAFVSKKRDRKAALKFLRKLMKRHPRPDAIITDRLRSYRAALRELGGTGRHQAGRWLNNRAENSHLPFRRREHDMLRFRRMRSLQKFATVHSSVYNHFNLRRFLCSRDNFKLNRAAALASGVNSGRPNSLSPVENSDLLISSDSASRRVVRGLEVAAHQAEQRVQEPLLLAFDTTKLKCLDDALMVALGLLRS